jgi:glycosyltransferase involved in cell wall biosynthesis
MPEPIKVALDGTPMAGPIGGIRRFTDQLVLALRTAFPDDNYTLLSDQFAPTPKGLERRWWLYGLNKAIERSGAQVFHGTDFAVPYVPNRPTVLTVHDLSPWLRHTPASARVRNRTSMLLRLRIPTFVHTPSEAVRAEVIDYFRWPADRIVAIPHAAASHFTPTPQVAAPYFLYLGTLEARKNLGVLRDAIALLWEQGIRIPLRLAGHKRAGYEIPTHEGIQYIGPQEEASLPSLLSNAKAVLYPSLYEGFGLPILEAMQCGAPVIASDIPVHREVGAAAAYYANPADPAAWSDQMRDVLDNPPSGSQSTDRAAQFSWDATAKSFRQLYERCIDGMK